mgnify:CR=1 FL=1
MLSSDKLIKINDSEKQRPSTLGETKLGKDQKSDSCLKILKYYKWKIFWVTIFFIVAGIVTWVLIDTSGGDKPPTPTPPGPKPNPPAPVPVNTGYNLYYMDKNDTVKSERNKKSGYLRWRLPEPNSTYRRNDD